MIDYARGGQPFTVRWRIKNYFQSYGGKIKSVLKRMIEQVLLLLMNEIIILITRISACPDLTYFVYLIN